MLEQTEPLAAKHGALLLVQVGEVEPRHPDHTVVGPVQPGDAGEKGRLSGAGRAHDRSEASFGQVEVDAIEGMDGSGADAVGVGEATNGQCG